MQLYLVMAFRQLLKIITLNITNQQAQIKLKSLERSSIHTLLMMTCLFNTEMSDLVMQNFFFNLSGNSQLKSTLHIPQAERPIVEITNIVFGRTNLGHEKYLNLINYTMRTIGQHLPTLLGQIRGGKHTACGPDSACKTKISGPCAFKLKIN